ncbi:MAG: hypothetical protein WCO54_01155 [Bacteroidota bacterium]
MPNYIIKPAIICVIILLAIPSFLLAQPTFGGTLNDTSTPIDSQTLLLASGGVVYAFHKIRESRRKK